MEESIKTDDREVKLMGLEHLKVVRLKIGKDGRTCYNFSPNPGGVPQKFLAIPEVAWREASEEDVRGALRRYVASLREDGEMVVLSVADNGIVRLDLAFNGVKSELWFNAWTSNAIVLGAEGRVCE